MVRLLVFLVACGGGGGGGGGDGGKSPDASAGGPTLSDQYPGDVGLGSDPAVIWFEDFEEGSVAAITSRYNQAQGMARMQVTSDAEHGSALALTAGGAVQAVDLYKQLPDHDDVFVRWYVKYDPAVPWHHSGMWVGGYNPAMPYPSPMAGYRPNGDDRFSIAIEPAWNIGSTNARLDFYNYWMNMHSWMPDPINDNGTAYYGNSLVHRNAFTLDETSWICLEVHLRVDSVLEVWKNDGAVARFDAASPLGYWVRDKFCPGAADGTECTDYAMTPSEILNLQMRSTTIYAVNAFWPQNYITDPAMGTLRFDQMVVATTRIGCLR